MTDEFLNTPQHFDTLLVRNHDMVHVRTCYRVSGTNVNPWKWAEAEPATEIIKAQINGVKFCRSCDPIEAAVARDVADEFTNADRIAAWSSSDPEKEQ